MRREPLLPPASLIDPHRRGLTLIESIAVLLILALVAWLLSSVRWTARRMGRGAPLCASHLKNLGVSMRIYSSDFGGSWASPAFDESAVGSIDYRVRVGGGEGSVRSPNREQPSVSGSGGAAQLSTSRALWILARKYDAPGLFVCPNSGDQPDETTNLDRYYDFADYRNMSYGYHVPFGPPETRPREGMDNRMAIAADKGPYVDASVAVPSPGLATSPAKADDPNAAALALWSPFNSRNHGGTGQYVLFADGHVEFLRTPIVGIDNDNIYTVAIDGTNPGCRTAGESSWMRSAHPLVTVDPATGARTSTDSVIFP